MRRQINKQIGDDFKTSFIVQCLESLQLGYENMVLSNQYDVDWEEDNLTAHLVEKIEETGFLRSRQISVNHQPPLYDKAVINEGKTAREAPRVDLKFSKWQYRLEHHYYAEAKNLSEKKWQKKSGAWVNASRYKGRYIDTGIENLVFGRYPEGCLLGYIVQGREAQVVSGINKLIQARGLPPKIGLIQKDETVLFPTCYCSSHTLEGRQLTIHHVFMQFWKGE